MIIATAGHVDHGKTSLVTALTGIDTDRLKEEKQRGLTIDLGFAYSDAESGERLGFVDVPGHISFINNMLAGVSAIDCALLVVAADDGIMPQTLEHLQILNLLGIEHGLIALTKIDRCDPSQIAATQAQISEVTQGTFLENSDIYPVSAVSGEGIETLQIALELQADDLERRRHDGRFRLAIDRRFSVKGSGIVVTGSVFSGTAKVGDELFLMPQQIPVRIRGLRTQNQEAGSTHAGDRCAVNIAGQNVELEAIHRGNWLTSNPAAATSRADILLTVSASEKKPLAHWTPVHIHSAANHVTGRTALLEPTRIEPGAQGLAQLVFEPAINLCFGDRVVLRDQGATRTIGGGRVISTTSPKRGRARPERIRLLASLDPANLQDSITSLINQAELGVARQYLCEAFNLTEQELASYLTAQSFEVLGQSLVMTTAAIETATALLAGKLDAWHEANPGKAGLPKNQVSQLARLWPGELFDHVLAELIAADALHQDGNLYKRPGYGVQLNHQELAIWQAVLPLMQAEPLKPPVLHELASTLSVDPKALEKVLNQVLKTGQLVRPVKNRYFLVDAIPTLIQAMLSVADNQRQFTVKQYRDATGIGRNLSIEILEYFDRQGYTRRIGDIRQITEKV